jgi:hypothetical protein
MFDLITAVTIVASDLGGTAIGNAMMIDLDKSAEIRGVDENKNGLRDDFEKMLINKVKDDKERNMLYHMLTYMDKAIEFGSTKSVDQKEEALEIFKTYELNKVFQCVSRGGQSLYTFIDKKFPSTKERKKAYVTFNNAFAKNKYKVEKGMVNCDVFYSGIPNYTETEFKNLN